MFFVDEEAQGTGPIVGLNPSHCLACRFGHVTSSFGSRAVQRGHRCASTRRVNGDDHAGPKDVVIEDADNGRGASGDEGPDGCREIIDCFISEEQCQICPLPPVNISKPETGIERKCICNGARHFRSFLIECFCFRKR
jgi:hypothetical protein